MIGELYLVAIFLPLADNPGRGFLSAKTQYREKGQKGRTRKTSRLELAIKRHVTGAWNGDVGTPT